MPIVATVALSEDMRREANGFSLVNVFRELRVYDLREVVPFWVYADIEFQAAENDAVFLDLWAPGGLLGYRLSCGAVPGPIATESGIALLFVDTVKFSAYGRHELVFSYGGKRIHVVPIDVINPAH